MGIFSHSSPFDQIVEKATLETNTKEDWSVILDICDRVGTSSQAPKECLRAIVKRLNHQDPHVVLQAIVVLDACVSNCGLPFHLEVASRDFEQEFRRTISKTHEKAVRDKLLHCLQKWAENEFKTDPQLDLIPSLYNKLKSNGIDFPSSDSPSKGKKGGHHHKKDSSSGATSGAAGQQEDLDLAKAIELSLKEAQASPQNRSLYPQAVAPTSSGSSGSGSNSHKDKEKESIKVRALYDFEAAEDNELTFYAGEIVHVLDDTDPNWWEGSNQRGTGLFPANFVTTDLSAEPPKFESVAKKTVKFVDEVEVKSVEAEPEVNEIDVDRIDKALHYLHEADPTGEIPDPPELANLEDQVQKMGPLIDQELEKIDRRHAQLTRLGTELVEALNMYHNLMREIPPPHFNLHGMPGPNAMPPFPQGGPMPYPNYPGFPNHMGYQNQMVMPGPPHSAPPATGMYNNISMPYQVPQINGIPHQSASDPHVGQNPNQVTLNEANISNSQIQGPPQLQPLASIPNHQMHQQMNMNVPQTMQNSMPGPGGVPFTQGMMMPPHGQQILQQIPQQQPPPQHNQMNQHMSMPPMTTIGQPMPLQQGIPQQFGPPQQFYVHHNQPTHP